jgi:hypothetical protein
MESLDDLVGCGCLLAVLAILSVPVVFVHDHWYADYESSKCFERELEVSGLEARKMCGVYFGTGRWTECTETEQSIAEDIAANKCKSEMQFTKDFSRRVLVTKDKWIFE